MPSGASCAWSCGQHGVCKEGKCECEDTHFGYQCDKEIKLMVNEVTTF
jgi:hypothetical protein